ncbi:hypothetical protein K1719_046709 [Acacia pycnantha]|nr:hypothetical protein K1719_046709 [Acacia pycnantha]
MEVGSFSFDQFDLVFPDGKFPAGGKSDIEGIFPPPYFEWFQFNKEFTEYTNFEECISYLCEYITTNGPFDGLLGFSQGATLSALLMGYQTQGKVLKEHPPMKLFVSISGSKFRDPSICDVAYKDIIKFLEELMQKCQLRLECLLDGSSIVGFGSKSSSRYQVIIRCYWFLFTAGGCQVPHATLLFYVEFLYMHFFDVFSWSDADWSCPTLIQCCCC